MKIFIRLLAALWALLLLAASPAFAATLYVSNTASNGYALGSDSNACTSVGAPCLTVDKAAITAAASDTIYINPTATAYVENTGGLNYLTIPKSLTIQTDPALVATQGKAIIQATSTTRTLNLSGAVINLTDLIVDANGVGKSSALFNAQSVAITLTATRIDIKNMISTNIAFVPPVNGVWTMDKVTMTTANGNASTTRFARPFNAGTSMTFKGITASGIATVIKGDQDVTTSLIRFTTSADGTRNTISNVAEPIVYPKNAVQTNIDIQSVDFSGTITQAIWGQQSTGEQVTALAVKYCTFTGATYNAVTVMGAPASYGAIDVGYNDYAGSGRLYYGPGLGTANALIHDNKVVLTSATAPPVQIVAGGSGIQIYSNKFTTDVASGHGILIGPDGQGALQANTATATSTIALGSSTANAWVYQPVTHSGTSSRIASSFRFKLAAVGSPTGTVTGYLYDNSAGVPGAQTAVSEYTMSAAALTSTAQWVEFWLPSHPTTTLGATYHLVLRYNGTPDASNYVTLASNVTGTVGGTSADGVAWTASAKVALFQWNRGAFEITDPIVRNNTVTCTANLSTTCHAILIGATLGGKAYNNWIIGPTIGLIFKLADGSDPAHPVLGYDNLIRGNNPNSAGQLLRDKGSRSVLFAHNTLVANGNGTASAIGYSNDYDATFGAQYNGQPSLNFVSKNNLIWAGNASGTAYVYAAGLETGTDAAFVRVINPTIDHDLVYFSGNVKALTDATTGAAVAYDTWAAMQERGLNPSGINADPLLTSITPAAVTDFLPLNASPAYGAGADLSAIVATDYNADAFANPPDIGAWNLVSRVRTNSRGLTSARTLVR
jgi:hypothetical protein